MKKMNKKGFTLVELLAVIVLLAILAVGLYASVGSTMNKSKRNNFVTAYNDVRRAIEDKVALGETPKTGDKVETDYDLSGKDYDLKVTAGTDYYEIVLSADANGTYKNIKLKDEHCGKRKGTSYVPSGKSNTCITNAAPSITGYVEQ